VGYNQTFANKEQLTEYGFGVKKFTAYLFADAKKLMEQMKLIKKQREREAL